ncbi:MAG: hypothetical protein ABSC51_08590 [Gaiellaceae bacterium]|jgi:hypothetical protein
MTKRRLGTVAVLAIGAALLLCSCGGGGSKRLSKAQFAAKANALCAAYHLKVKAIATPTSVAELVAGYNKLLPLQRKLVSDMEKLKPPANEEAQVKQAVALGKKQIDRAVALVAAALKGDMAQMNTLIAAGNASKKETATIFTALGVTECAKS